MIPIVLILLGAGVSLCWWGIAFYYLKRLLRYEEVEAQMENHVSEVQMSTLCKRDREH